MTRRQRLTASQITELFDPPASNGNGKSLHAVGSGPCSNRSLPWRYRLGHALCCGTCAIPVVPCVPANGRRRRCLHLSLSRSGSFLGRLTHTSRQSGIAGPPCHRMPAPGPRIASVRQANGGGIGGCPPAPGDRRRPLRPSGSAGHPKLAGNAELSFRLRLHSNGCAANSAIEPAGRSIAAWQEICPPNSAAGSMR